MVDIQSATLRLLRLGEEKRRKKEEETTGQKYNGMPYYYSAIISDIARMVAKRYAPLIVILMLFGT